MRRHPSLLVVAAAVPALLGAVQAPPLAGPCATATATAVVAAPGEPGTRMVVSGVVYRDDGTTPAPGVVMYVYQTDASGQYGRDARGGPRLRGWMKTDAQGRYRYETIRPGLYPDHTEPAHVHVQFWGGPAPMQWTNDLQFEGGALVKPALAAHALTQGRFGAVRPVTTRDGVQHVEQDFRLKPRADRFEPVITHGLDACR